MPETKCSAVLRSTVAFLAGAGVAAAVSLPVQPLAWTMLVGIVTIFAILFREGGRFSSVALLLLASVVGMFVMTTARAIAEKSPLSERMCYKAVVMGDVKQKGRVWRFDALVVDVRNRDVAPFMVKMSVLAEKCPLRLGDEVECSSVFERPSSYGRFDYARYLSTQGFRATTMVFGTDLRPMAFDKTGIPIFYRIRLKMLLLRKRLLSIYAANGIHGDNLAVLSAMTLGDKSLLSDDVKTAYSVSGGAHVLALSGLHMGVVFSLLMMLFGGMRLTRLHRFQMIIVVVSVWLYTLLVGMPVSALRSALMLSVMCLGSVSMRGGATADRLALAAMAVVAVSPMSLLDAGFQMSFVSVASILFFVPQVMRLFFSGKLWQNVCMRWVAGIVAVSLAAQIGVAPLTAYYFGRLPVYFLLSNFVAVPLAALLLYGGLGVLLLSAVPFLQHVLAVVLDSAVTLLSDTLRLITSLPCASIEGIHVSPFQLLLMYAVLACVYRCLYMLEPNPKIKPLC